MRVRLGTSGFAYAPWRGRFYPRGLPATRMLEHYALHFDAVEINQSFRELPSAQALDRWREQTPAGFHFALKAPQALTHVKRLVGASAWVRKLLAARDRLGERAGPLLFQLPPNFKADLPRLERFLRTLPLGVPTAFEFRHPSWFVDGTYAALRDRDAALCIAESEELATPLIATASFGYLRLRRDTYGPRSLTRWHGLIAAQPWSETFVFFKHEDTARGPRYARALGRHWHARPL